MSERPDETWHRLRTWTSGSASAERLALQVLLNDGYSRGDPTHPLGGPDGGIDAWLERSGLRWAAAFYFPVEPQPFTDVLKKFETDAKRAIQSGAERLAFVTNQHLTKSQRVALGCDGLREVDIYHLERVASVLDRPDMSAARARFLFLEPDSSPPSHKRASPAFVAKISGTRRLRSKVVGRDVEIASMRRFFEESDGATALLVEGMPGVGKSALVEDGISRVMEQQLFTGGCVEVDFDSFSPARDRDVLAHEPLAAMMAALGAEIGTEDPSAQFAAWHRLLDGLVAAGQGVLLVFENVASAEQVKRLMPRSGEHRSVVTSRRTLSGLDVEVHRLHVGSLDVERSLELLAREVAPERDTHGWEVSPEVRSLIDSCAGLPLAISIVAALLKEDPDLSLSDLANELHRETSRIRSLEYGDIAIRAAFDQTARRIDARLMELLTLIALHPGPEISTRYAAELAGEDTVGVRSVLRRLRAWHLIESSGRPNSWKVHDLVKAYVHGEPNQRVSHRLSRRDAVRRLVNAYKDDLDSATRWINNKSDTPDRGEFSDRASSLDWLHREIDSAFACALLASEDGDNVSAWHIAVTAGEYYNVAYRLSDGVNAAELAAGAARTLRSADKEAAALNNVGLVHNSLRNFDKALSAFMAALKLYRKEGDLIGQARVLTGISECLRVRGDKEAAIAPVQRAIRLYQAADDPASGGFALTNLGIVLRELGRFGPAREALARALLIHSATGARHAEASTLAQLGTCETQMRHPSGAIDHLRSAIDAYRELGDLSGEGMATMNLGNAYKLSGSLSAAIECYNSAILLFESVGNQEGLIMARANVRMAGS